MKKRFDIYAICVIMTFNNGRQLMKIRPIVRAAFKVDQLVYQFEDIDIEDGYLDSASMEEVNEKYSDKYIIGEAENRLNVAMDPLNQEEEYWRKDAAQLRRFIKRFSPTATMQK